MYSIYVYEKISKVLVREDIYAVNAIKMTSGLDNSPRDLLILIYRNISPNPRNTLTIDDSEYSI